MPRTDFALAQRSSPTEAQHIRDILPALLAKYALLVEEPGAVEDEADWSPTSIHAEYAEHLLVPCHA